MQTPAAPFGVPVNELIQLGKDEIRRADEERRGALRQTHEEREERREIYRWLSEEREERRGLQRRVEELQLRVYELQIQEMERRHKAELDEKDCEIRELQRLLDEKQRENKRVRKEDS